ncbi:MAG: 4Fe-4S dicluster domain-containing protein [Candidatus Latescibacteria bacterium]|nr:4Fe-4S dicluster domain-containing protein [Candidatus Latescibacterota bacterium]NIO29009.1 4Fe-4S dicluster domain-containing protein [Candidatus Latescibacterota bacterium]NIO56634.1 4Fe-4S dicluster domain-containing protein [Candidatus Latescibacterota bacterium]NIT02218.1 4Fe-4S dicluster domain-containing protein [Candidatus Latescibacterota bacterium]NIT39103.1 4Fe-4S dicluster domain-containing protein [Candidatus Latescibacterota bacterium]
MFGLRYLTHVVTLELDEQKCNGCRMCVEVCPHAVFEIVEKRAKIIDRDACMECGACAMNCPEGALVVNAGVGCATAVITGAIRGTEPTCDCAADPDCC